MDFMDDSIFYAASQAYSEYMEKHGWHLFCEPIQMMSEIDDKFVYLANNSSLLAMYEIATGEITL